MKIGDVAKLCHEANAVYCELHGDYSQPAWEKAPGWQRESAVNGVRFHLEHLAGPEASHEHWLEEKLKAGWTYGPVKDPEKKQHPCCVPFSSLPPEQRAKDHLFRAIVHALDSAGVIER